MGATTLTPPKAGKADRQTVAANFWGFIARHAARTDAERIQSIQDGFPPTLSQTIRVIFQLQDGQVEVLLNASTSTLERRRREHKRLDSVASERLDRIATVSQLAQDVFEDNQAAIDWLSRTNDTLGGQAPIMLCETEIGTKQVRRALHAMEWGGAV